MSRTFWTMAKERFIYGYPIFTGLMLFIFGAWIGSDALVEFLNGDTKDLGLLVASLTNSEVLLGTVAPILIGFPLLLTFMLIMMGTIPDE